MRIDSKCCCNCVAMCRYIISQDGGKMLVTSHLPSQLFHCLPGRGWKLLFNPACKAAKETAAAAEPSAAESSRLPNPRRVTKGLSRQSQLQNPQRLSSFITSAENMFDPVVPPNLSDLRSLSSRHCGNKCLECA